MPNTHPLSKLDPREPFSGSENDEELMALCAESGTTPEESKAFWEAVINKRVCPSCYEVLKRNKLHICIAND